MLFDKEIIILQQENLSSKEAVLTELAQCFKAEDLVTDQFMDGVLNREQNFPTGLIVNDIGIAIPHTDSDKVKQSQIGFMSLKEPVAFQAMDGSDKTVPVRLVFMLGLKESHEQLDILSKLMDLIQKQSVLEALLSCTNKADYFSIIRKENLI
ncbi:PTS system, galactitol-specific IIA component [Halolactibacillus halophilus]|uniref:PTS fructose transporter subunit IIA n=1 Tax=Halolactibacillus halophilus TaxID=306540 RepID=A0A1I5Q7H9_9BACI|nr:PTS sugar transporter subunit IIA [Halolactibacillus halophilus]GEM01633.1 PTS fructose transporter subunit IIA [Halolactibacillus halophilus]SFP42112.1 PTS system, galactitol-specific IIA component [Halolactibacillus halophilus]